MMPIEMLRALLANQPLAPGSKPAWRFLDELPAH
jgi:hypothetical protein